LRALPPASGEKQKTTARKERAYIIAMIASGTSKYSRVDKLWGCYWPEMASTFLFIPPSSPMR
jgi:hypothetical protein